MECECFFVQEILLPAGDPVRPEGRFWTIENVLGMIRAR